MKRGGPTLTRSFLLKMAEIEKYKRSGRKLHPLSYPNMSKSRLCFLLPFQGQHDYFLQYLGCFCQETGQSQKSRGQNQNLTKFSKFVKTCWFQHFPVLQVYRGHLRKIFTGFSSLAADLIKNLMLNRLAPISNPKNEKAKSSYELFLLPFFVLRPT